MTTGNILYLLMCLGMFSTFAVTLAYVSWQQSQEGPEMITSGVATEQPQGHAVHA